MCKLNQKGFGIVEVLVVVVIFGLIGGAGYSVWQKSKTKNNSITSNPSKKNSNSSADKTGENASIETAVQKLEAKLLDLMSAQSVYKYEKLSSSNGTVYVKSGNDYKELTPKSSDVFIYRTDPKDASYEMQDSYIKAEGNTVFELSGFAVSELGFEKVETRTVELPAYNFNYTLYSYGDFYCQIGSYDGGGSIAVACVAKL